MNWSDMFLALILGSAIVGVGDWFVRQFVLRSRRFQGRAYDPNRPVMRRAGAVRVGMTGRVCHACGAITWGLSDRCGRCHLPTSSSSPQVAVERSALARSAVVLQDDVTDVSGLIGPTPEQKARMKQRVLGRAR